MKFFSRNTNRFIIAFNTLSQVLGKAIGASTVLVVSLVIARRFGAEGYGDFVKITTFVSFFFLLSDFGLNAVYLKDRRDEWETLVCIRMVTGAILMAITCILIYVLPSGISQSQGYSMSVRMGIALFAPAIFFQGLITSANAVFQKHLRYDFSTIALAMGSVGTLLVLWFVSVSRVSGPVFGTTAILAGTIIHAAAGLYFAVRLRGYFQVTFDRNKIMSLLVPAIPLGAVLLFNVVYFHADSVILTILRSTKEVGVYGLAFKIFELPLVIPVFFMNSVYPLLLQEMRPKGQKPGKNFSVLLKRSAVSLLFASLFSLLVVWVGSPMVGFVRSDFVPSIVPLRILALGFPLFFISNVSLWGLIALGRQRMLALVYGICMAGNIIANILFIGQYGYIASAWITVLSEGIVCVWTFVLLRSVLRDKKF